MRFKHACFISYRHPNDHTEESDRDGKSHTEEFLSQFCKALTAYLEQQLECNLYIDSERLKPGFKYNVAIANAIRESVCLVAVLSPRYFKSEYCRREYVFMQQIEEKRRSITGAPPEPYSLVIPLLVWSKEHQVPEEIRGHSQLTRLPFGLHNEKLQRIDEDANMLDVLKNIGEVIFEIHEHFDQLGHCGTAVSCCSDIDFPDIHSIGHWQTNKVPTQPFVGRNSQGGV